jgi:penicillin amidase
LFALRRAGFVVKKLRQQPEGWFPKGWAVEISAALATAHRLLMARPERSWGLVRPLVLRHPMGERRPLDRVFNLGPIPWGGDTNTVGQSSPDPMRPASDITLAIASLRVIVDLDDVERSRYVLPGGQSGNPFSSHYSDQLRLWRLGDGVPISWHQDAVLAATHHTLRLSPLQSQPG